MNINRFIYLGTTDSWPNKTVYSNAYVAPNGQFNNQSHPYIQQSLPYVSSYNSSLYGFAQPNSQAYFNDYTHSYYNNRISRSDSTNHSPVADFATQSTGANPLAYDAPVSKPSEENKANDAYPQVGVPIVAKTSSDYPVYFTTQRICPNPAKLSYTMFQKSLLESAYRSMKYPNSDQKTILSEKLGITRDQLKIWFQNRRRKDVLVHTSKGCKRARPCESAADAADADFDENNNFDEENEDPLGKRPMTEDDVRERICIDGVLNELKLFENGPSRLVKRSSSNKTSKNNSSDEKSFSRPDEAVPAARLLSLPSKSFSSGAALNTSPNASSTSAVSAGTSLTLSSSSGASSSSSGSSSDEEKAATLLSAAFSTPCAYQTGQVGDHFSFNVVKQTYSMHDYVNGMRSNAPASLKYPRVHNLDSAAGYSTNMSRSVASSDHLSSYYYPRPQPENVDATSLTRSDNYAHFNAQMYQGGQQAGVHYYPANYYPLQHASTINNSGQSFY